MIKLKEKLTTSSRTQARKDINEVIINREFARLQGKLKKVIHSVTQRDQCRKPILAVQHKGRIVSEPGEFHTTLTEYFAKE